MLDPAGQIEPTMLSETLQRLRDLGQIDVPRIADSACVSRQSIHNWIAGATDPLLTPFIRMFRALDHDAQLALLALIAGEAGWQHVRVDAVLDVNGDGRVDLADVLMAKASAAHRAAESIHRLARGMGEHKHILDTLYAQRDSAASAAADLLAAESILNHMIRQREQSRRRLTVGGAR